MDMRTIESKLQNLEDQLCLSRAPCNIPVKTVTLVTNTSRPDQHMKIVRDVVTVSDAKQLANEKDFAARLLCFSQTNSHRPVNATKSIMKELLLMHDVSEEFLEVLGGFHWKDITVEEALGTPFWTRYSREKNVLEYMFVYKYAERTNRKGAEPWTIRQSAFYHRVGISDKRSLYIVISPYQNTEAEEMIRRWFQGISSVTDHHQQVLQPAAMLLSLRLDQWRQYMKHYEREVTQVWTLVFCASSHYPESVTYDSLRNLHLFQNRLNPVAAIFGSLLGTLDGLEKILRKHNILHPKDSDELEDWEQFTYNSRMKLGAFQMNIKSIMTQCQNTLQFVDGAIKLDNQKIIARQSSHVLNLTGVAVDDSATIRVMTTITLIFLSFATIAAIMAMPIFYLNETKSLAVSSSWWIYLLLALLVTALTVTFWRWSLRRKRKARDTAVCHEKRMESAV